MATKSNATRTVPLARERITTPRAYTLRLRAAVDERDDMRTARRKRKELTDALWATHHAINRGARAFGDWLLTLRGGLNHELAEPSLPAKGKNRTAEEGAALRKNRRILLALSWLSVEDARGAPQSEGVRVATGEETPEERKDRVLAALREILVGRGLDESEIASWLADCADSLASRIRDDAVWINRSAMFDAARADIGPSLTRTEVWDMLKPFFASSESYLAPVELTDDEDGGGEADEKAKDLVQKAGQWLSSRFGTGTGADFSSMARVYAAMAEWAESATPYRTSVDALADLGRSLAVFAPASSDADGLLKLISGPGYKSATRNLIKAWGERGAAVTADDLAKFAEVTTADEAKASAKIGGKGRRLWSDRVLDSVEHACGFTYLQPDGPARHSQFAVMLDHAARRVSIGHSWIKRAEAHRRQFEVDAQKLAQVPAEAAALLDGFIERRGGASGGDYRIRRRAIQGWDKIVDRWSRKDCANVEDRIRAARELQDDPEIDKFGDIQLFEALAADDSAIVWRAASGNTDTQALTDYVLGHDARFRQRHYKVPAYRHPDPLRHPVFGDFGNSRWDIAYAAHEAAKATRSKPTPGASKAAWLRDRWGLRMKLWDGDAMREMPLRWSSKRLAKDLSLAVEPDATHRAASRADRLGRAAAGVNAHESARPSGLFALDDWNGRLQAPRSQLDAIAARVERCGWDAAARSMRDSIKWLVSFSAKLECRGPFDDYAASFEDTDPAKPFLSRKGERAIKHATNEQRSGHAKLILSRLPGLRVLSVDLGHRFAASCAVWEALSADTFKTESAGRTIVAGAEGGLFVHTRHTDATSGKQLATIYRRIGGDTLADGTPHPTPWARLDRQFLVKLQGEQQPPRKASPREIIAVEEFEDAIGRTHNGEQDRLPNRVDLLMAAAVRSARIGLRRHGDAARIAYAFMPGGVRHRPGGATEEHTTDSRTAAVRDALVRWHELGGTTTSRWQDPVARAAWNDHIAPRLTAAMPEPAEDATGPQRKAHCKALEAALAPLATQLAASGETGLPELFKLWQARWDMDHTQWRAHLKGLNRWLLPRGVRARRNETQEQTNARKARLGAARNIGGLSLTRIATVRELWQVQKAFHYGARPCDLRAGVRKMEADALAGHKFGDTALRTMERLREQRVKQIASRIAASALGLGGHWKSVQRRDHAGRLLLDGEGKVLSRRVWVEEPTAKYPPCHAVVIENLRNYRPDELQTRRENRALMAWSSAKVAKYLGESCQLHGLLLREVSPNYTSRQCSRTGLPGMRCVGVPVCAKTGEPDAWWWKKALAAAQTKAGNGGERDNGKAGDAESRLIVALAEHLRKAKDAGDTLPSHVLLPRKGGDLFVAAPTRQELRTRSFGKPGAALQADLNAAANIGLRALLDPDFIGRWWFVLFDPATGKPAKEKTAGAACLALDQVLLGLSPANTPDQKASGAKKRVNKPRERANAWRDVGSTGDWREHKPYWNDVTARVIERLRVAIGFG